MNSSERGRDGSMAAVLNPDVLQDELAVVLARVVAAANRCAREAGVDVLKSLITIFQISDETIWRVNYGPKDYLSRRGGDFIVDVDGRDASIKRVLRGQ